MTPDEARQVLELVEFRDYDFLVVEHDGGEFSLQVRFTSPDDGDLCLTRKWRLSTHMTRGEVVQTALKALLTSAEHQVREFFAYRGRAIFGPHYDVDKLWDIAGCVDARPEIK